MNALQQLVEQWRAKALEMAKCCEQRIEERTMYESLSQHFSSSITMLDNCADELDALLVTLAPAQEEGKLQMDREVIIMADSLLSLLWHRHTPPEIKNDFTLSVDVNRTIAELRAAYETPRQIGQRSRPQDVPASGVSGEVMNTTPRTSSEDGRPVGERER